MEAPKAFDEVVLKIKENGAPFTLRFSLQSSSLCVNITEDDSVPSINYFSKFNLSDLKEHNRYFRMFDSLEQLMPEIKNLCDEGKVKIKKDKTSVKVFLAVPLSSLGDVALDVAQAEMDQKQVIADLCQKVNELNKEIKLLKIQTCLVPDEKLDNNLKSENILLNEEETNMVKDWILKRMKSEGKKVEMTRLYKLKNINGDSYSTFHSYCNGKNYTLTLIRTSRGYRCGGFITQSWSSSGNYITDKNAFLFSLEFKEMYPVNIDGTNAIYDNGSYCPTFGNGHDLYIANGCSSNYSSYCNFPYAYYGTKQRCLTGGVYNFKVDDMEVYQIKIV